MLGIVAFLQHSKKLTCKFIDHVIRVFFRHLLAFPAAITVALRQNSDCYIVGSTRTTTLLRATNSPSTLLTCFTLASEWPKALRTRLWTELRNGKKDMLGQYKTELEVFTKLKAMSLFGLEWFEAMSLGLLPQRHLHGHRHLSLKTHNVEFYINVLIGKIIRQNLMSKFKNESLS